MPISLRDFKPFNILPESVLADLEIILKVKTYPKETNVFTEGQQSLGCLFLVSSGLAEIVKGNSGVVGLRHPGEFFGETVILTGKRYPATVKVVEQLTCLLMEQHIFENLLQTHKEFAGYFSHILTDRLRELYEEMVLEQPGVRQGAEPFKKRVVDIMSSPIATCLPETRISEIARILAGERISSLVVTDKTGKMLGMVTERDLITKVLALNRNPGMLQAVDIMNPSPPTLPQEAYFYQALLTMLQTQGKYIVVMDQSQPIGLVTIGDLSRARITSSIAILKDIEEAVDVAGLAMATGQFNTLMRGMLAEKAPVNQITELVSELSDSLTRRLITLAEDYLYRQGMGSPPVDYCWLTMGSGGRKELNLASDQDNAIIYAEPGQDREEGVKQYFAELSKFVSDGLEKCGFAKCPGNIMATNPAWCQNLAVWKTSIQTWTFSPNPDSSLQFEIFLDFRPVYGQYYLARELREHTIQLFRKAPAILHHMVREDLSHRVPLSVFKKVITERSKEHRDEVDLKKAACVHIVNCVRILTMREGISETNTLARLSKLVETKALAAEDSEYYEAAMQSLMLFRIRENLRKATKGKIPDNYINPNVLSKRERSVLRESFLAIDRLQNFIGFVFQIEGYL